jgi:hypothetical protein
MADRIEGIKRWLRRIYTLEGLNGVMDDEAKRKAVILNLIFTVVILFLTPYVFIAYADGNYWLSIFDLIAIILMVIFHYYLKYTGDYMVAYFTSFFIGALLLFVVITGGVENTGPLWAYTWPMLAMFLLGTKKGAAWLSAYFCIVALILLLPGAPFLLTTYGPEFKIRFISTFLAVCVISFFLQRFYSRTVDKMAARIRQLEEALMEVKKTGD